MHATFIIIKTCVEKLSQHALTLTEHLPGHFREQSLIIFVIMLLETDKSEQPGLWSLGMTKIEIFLDQCEFSGLW